MDYERAKKSVEKQQEQLTKVFFFKFFLRADKYPNLRLLTKHLADPSQKESLENIIKNKPHLAKTLDLYANGFEKLKTYKVHIFLLDIFVSQISINSDPE